MRRKRLVQFASLVFPNFAAVEKIFEFVKPQRKSKMNLPSKLAIGAGVTMFVIIIFGWVAFPKLISSKIKSQLTLKPNGEIRGMYTKIPFPLTFKIYVFNVTNHLEVTKGDTPVLDEIGPYVFEEWKEKVETVDDEAEDTLTFRMKDTFIFNKEASAPLTGEEMVVIPHPMIVGMVMFVAQNKPAMLNLIGKAINIIFENPETPFITTSVNDVLFDGLTINCTTTDFAAKAVCTQLKTEGKDLIHVSDTVFKFSVFGARNGSAGNKFKVKRGIKNSRDLGRVIEFEDKSELDVWPEKECNQFHGTDGTIFPPFLKKEEGLESFAPDMCRSLKATYHSDTVFDGIPCFKYTASLGDMSTDPTLKCYCPTPETCLKKGLMDLTKCAGAPIIVSLPHFYDSDPMYLKGVRGLRPREEDHGISILFEAMSGSPLAAAKRLQFSFPLAPVEKVAFMKTLPTSIVPFFWVEEGVQLNSTFTAPLKNQLLRTIKVVKILKWLILAACLGILGIAGFLQYKGKVNAVSITPVKSVMAVANDLQQKSSNVISMISSNPNDLQKNSKDNNEKQSNKF